STGASLPALTLSARLGASLSFVGWAAAGPAMVAATASDAIRARTMTTGLLRVELMGSSVRSDPVTLQADRSRNEDEALHQAARRAVYGHRLGHRHSAGSA